MNNTDLARRLMATGRVTWMPGIGAVWHGIHGIVLAVLPRGRLKFYAHESEQEPGGVAHVTQANCVPDLDDPATIGCLIHQLRKAWKDPGIAPTCHYSHAHGYRWMIREGHPHGSTFNRMAIQTHATEAEAIVAAFEALP